MPDVMGLDECNVAAIVGSAGLPVAVRCFSSVEVPCCVPPGLFALKQYVIISLILISAVSDVA